MATLSKAESRRLYSWWWDSHISPKNSKWLKENLTDMDLKVKAMIKLIEEDADSFARRAEMYYKKRPELMKLVEEFYRAYRALAERYDHATGALRQAHKTIQEAFPNQIPFVMTDETQPSSSGMESGPHASEIAPNSPHFDPDRSHKDDAMGSPSHFHARKRNGAHIEEHDTLSGRNGLEQLNEVFATNEVAAGSKFDVGRERKSPKFREEEIEVINRRKRNGLRDLPQHDFIEKRDLSGEIKRLQEEISQLSKENQDLDNQISSETQRADKAETEAQVLRDTLSRLNSEKEAAYIHYQQSLQKLASLEAEMSRTKEEFKDLNDNMLMGVEKFNKAEEQRLVLEKNNEALQLELDMLKGQHNELIDKTITIDLYVESLQASLKDLENERLEVQAICGKREDEKQMLLDELKNMEKVSEKNLVLENSLSDVNAELEGLRQKIKVLEESCESLHKQISLHVSEKAALASQVEAVSQKMEELSEQNASLENSLSDANLELESQKGKLKELEESFYSLKDQYSTLLAEKNALLLQLEDIQQKLADLEIRHDELHDKHLILEREKELTLHQVSELQDFLKHEKQENEHLTSSSKGQKASLESQIRKLQEECRHMEEELDVGQLKFMNSQFEILILQRCLCEMKERNMIHSTECQKHLEMLSCIEKQKSELEHDYLIQKQAAASLSEHKKKLSVAIHDLLKTIRTNKKCPPVGVISDEVLLQLAASETKDLLNYLSEVKDQNQHLIIDRLVTITLLKQLGVDAAGIKLENDVLERELDGKNEELSRTQLEMQKLMEMNKHLTQDVQASNYRRNAFITEMEIISKWLSQLKDAHNILKGEFLDLLREYQSLSFEIIDLKGIKEKLESENNVILSEAMTLDCLHSIFQSISKDKALQLQKLGNDMDSIVDVKNGIDKENRILNEKLGMKEAENMHLNGLVLSLESYKSHSMVLENDLQEARDVIFALSEDKAHKENEVASLRQANELLSLELERVQKEAEQSKYKAEHLTSELQNPINEIKYCEVETAALLDELNTKTINAEIFEEKVLELLLACETLETSSLIQREMLRNAIRSRDVYQNELKEKLNALAGPIALSLHDSISLLEESILQLAKSHESNIQEKEDNFLAYHHQDKATPEATEDQNASIPVEVLQFQKLKAKVEALRDLVINVQNRQEEEKLPANPILVAQRKETEELRSEKGLSQLRALAGAVPEIPLNMLEGDGENSQEFDGQLMKDIQLDHVSNSSPYSNGVSSYSQDNIENAGGDDQIYEPWITSQRDYTNSVEDASSLAKEHDINCHEIQAVEKQKSEYPSSLVAEKELGIDKLELSKTPLLEPQQEWNSRVIERLALDAERLAVLQANAEVLKGKITASNNGIHNRSIELDAVKAQLKEAEGTIKELIGINEELKKVTEDYSASSDSVAAVQKGMGEKSRKQISVSARRRSEKIGRLELELQKIEYVFLKLKEEQEYRSRATGRWRRRVMLRDYLYGRQNSRKHKKAHFCGCMRPNTDSD